MEKQRICKICNRRFSNGKAMGGHMRSHLAKLPIPPKPSQSQSPSSSSSYSSLLSLPNNTTTNDDEEAESTRPRNRPTRRRSKRRRKEAADKAAANDKPLSSLYDTFFSEEEVALCLIMLSRDQWNNKNGVFDDKEEEEEDDHEDEYEEEEEDEEEEGVLASTSRTRGRNHHQFKCETCNKVFRSYQALGGHRASHKKIIVKTQILDEVNNGTNNGAKYVVERRTFECPFCYKVFESGQALGGHKKVHFSTHLSQNARNTSTTASSSPANKFKDNLVIDLNLPAPEEEADDDDDDEEVVTHESLSDY